MQLLDDVGMQREAMRRVAAGSLGSPEFRADYGLKYAYLAGAMYKRIASKEMVVALGQAGLMGFLGTGGVKLEQIEEDIHFIRKHLPEGAPFGMNMLNALDQPELEARTIDLFLKNGVRFIEAAAYMQVSVNLVYYLLKGAKRDRNGNPQLPNHILAKVSRPEVAAAFMSPPPEALVRQLVDSGRLTPEEASLASEVPMASDLCVEADSGGHTDQGVAYALMPAILRLRQDMQHKYRYKKTIRVGAAGGIGSPEAAAAAFVLGADFVMTGSINQCTVEAGISTTVKDMLQDINVQDTTYAPAGDMFELGAKVQVMRKGLFFPARANKLYELYSRHNSLDELDEKTKNQIETRYFRRTFDDVWQETKAYYLRSGRKTLAELEKHPKQKMALIFRWYFIHATRLAFSGNEEHKVDYQVHCGPAMGAFNQWVKGTELESWRNRKVAVIGEKIMHGAADVLNERLLYYISER